MEIKVTGSLSTPRIASLSRRCMRGEVGCSCRPEPRRRLRRLMRSGHCYARTFNGPRRGVPHERSRSYKAGSLPRSQWPRLRSTPRSLGPARLFRAPAQAGQVGEQASSMTYEIISTENGDVLGWCGTNPDEAIARLIDFVEQHRESHPGIESRVALLELDDDERRHDLLTAEEILRGSDAPSVPG